MSGSAPMFTKPSRPQPCWSQATTAAGRVDLKARFNRPKHSVSGEFIIMRPLRCKSIPDNVTATQNSFGLQVAVDLFQPLPLGFVHSGSDGYERRGNTH